MKTNEGNLFSKTWERVTDVQKRHVLLQESVSKERRDQERTLNGLYLGIIESLDLIELLRKESDSSNLAKIERRLTNLLKRHQVLEISCIGVTPGLVKVISTRSETDQPEGAILAVNRKGYQIGAHVVRPAEVISNRHDSE